MQLAQIWQLQTRTLVEIHLASVVGSSPELNKLIEFRAFIQELESPFSEITKTLYIQDVTKYFN